MSNLYNFKKEHFQWGTENENNLICKLKVIVSDATNLICVYYFACNLRAENKKKKYVQT